MLKKILSVMLCFVAMLSVASCQIAEEPVINSAVSVQSRISDINPTGKIKPISEDEVLEYKCKALYKKINRKYLILVNKDNPLSENYSPQLKSYYGGPVKIEATAFDAIFELLRDARKEKHVFWIASAYRSRKKQEELIKADIRKYKLRGMTEEEALEATYTYTMPVGCSEHETGLALDILDSKNGIMEEVQEKQEANIWLREHCWEYGFILRYPKDKEDITGIKYEPWHIRYVGKEAAMFMLEHDLTLEEFIAYVEK